MLLSTGEREAEVEIEAPGLDLGLPVGAAVREGTTVLSEDAYGAFTARGCRCFGGDAGGHPAPNGAFGGGTRPGLGGSGTGEAMLADQLVLLGIVDWPATDIAGRQELCREFLLHLLTQRRSGARHMRRTTRAGGLGAVWRQKRL